MMKIARAARLGIVTAALVAVCGVASVGTASAASVSGLPNGTSTGNGGLGGLQPPQPAPLPVSTATCEVYADPNGAPIGTLPAGQSGFFQSPTGDNYYANCPTVGDPSVNHAPQTGPTHNGPGGNANV